MVPPVDGSWPEVPRRPDGLRHPLKKDHLIIIILIIIDNHDGDDGPDGQGIP